MDPEPTASRRRLLATTGSVLAAALAGYPAMDTPVDGGGAEPSPTGTAPAGRPEGTESGLPTHTEGTTTESPSTPTPALDLREANVVGVAVTGEGEQYRFSVTLYHDDDGEDGYANWWQVETPAGERLGRRDLLHAHGTRPFTRSATVTVPGDVPCVVVRGHDQAHGYGGQAMVVTVVSGATRPVRQGPRARSLADVGCQ